MKKHFIALLIAFISTQSFSQSTNINSEEWNGMIDKFTSLKKEAHTPFQKWHVDILHFNLLTCGNRFSLPLPDILKNHKVSKGGSYSLISADTCLSLKTDTTSISCDKISVTNKPFTKIPKGFFLYQGIFVNPDENVPLPNSKIQASIKCALGNTRHEQFYHGEATLIYDKMRPTQFNTSQGVVNVLQSSAFLKFDGLKSQVGPTNLIQLQ